jgi:hypothetical protein
MPSEATRCEKCGEETRTVFGTCPNCGGVKDPSVLPVEESYRPPLFDWDEDDVFSWLWWVLPLPAGVALLIIGLIIDSAGLLVGGGLLAVLAIGGGVLT